MATQNTQPEYDDQQAVSYILDFLDKDDRKLVSEDDIQYVIDVIYDYYEKKGYFNEEDDEATQAEIDENDMFDFIMKAVKKDKMTHLTDELVDQILEGEYQYGNSIGIYNEEE